MSEGNSRGTSHVIGFAGELREKKGLRSLLSAYAQVNKKYSSSLLIVGDVRAGEDKQALEDFKFSHPNMQILITGFVSHSDLPAYYSLMDIFVHPSLRDGLPNALLEAMACGKAVIGTPVGGIPDAVSDYENGRLVSTNNAEDLAKAIDELLLDDNLRNKLGNTACQTIRNTFTMKKELEANLSLYRQLGLKV
jgi:glycosyltransferase involved in cell wall biosynthesis